MSDDSENPQSPPAADLAAALALLRALHGEDVPDGPLGPATVPESVLALPIKAAMELFEYHGKVCTNVHCHHLPPPLRPYRRMRRQAIQGAASQVNEVLWVWPDHDLVVTVREAILDEYDELASLVSKGELLQGGRLGELLNDPEGVFNLTAVLWASRFESPQAEELFRCLVPLAVGASASGTDAPRRPGADRESMKELKAECRKLRRELKGSADEAGRLQAALRRSELALEKVRRDHGETRERAEAAAAEVGRLEDRLRRGDSAIEDHQLKAAQAERVNADLLRDRRRLQEEIRRKEQERSRLASRLANENTRLKRLEQQAASRPRGADAVWRFLRRQKERIQADLAGDGAVRARAEGDWSAHLRLEEAFLAAHPRYRPVPAVSVRPPKPPLRLDALGGSSEIGRSCYLLELGGRRILVDCGIKPGASRDQHPGFGGLDRIDALLLTHAHTDHIGWVPALVRRFGDDLDIYCSSATAALLPVQLQDCRQHYLHKMRLQRDNAQYGSDEEGPRDAYGQEDVDRVPCQVHACGFEEETRLPFDDISIRFFPAGHILGAASILVEDGRGRRVFFSGDFSSFPQLTTPAASWPEDLGEVDLLVLESTYGNRRHQPMERVRADLVTFLRETTQTREGSVILASFALGRAQELLQLVAAAQARGELPASLPVHFDGMIREINPIYANHADFDLPESFREVAGPYDRQEAAEGARTVPSVIVTTSGMLTGGPVVEYARRLLPEPRHRIVLTGYQDEGAPSRALRELASPGLARTVRLSNGAGGGVEIRAALPAKEASLSGHADQPGLVSYAGRLRPRHIALVHGEPAAQEELGARLAERHPGAAIVGGPDELEIG